MSGIAILHWFESMRSPVLDRLMLLITNLHSETIYILVLPLIFWLLDKRAARQLVAVFVLGMWANDVLKNLFHTQRPFVSHPELEPPQGALETATGGAFPSGHAMNPLMFWGQVALIWRRRWLTWVVGIAVFLIGLSRLYLGVHWPLDILGGWAFGAILLWCFQATARFWRGEAQPFGQQIVLALLLPLVALGISLLIPGTSDLHTLVTMVGAYVGLSLGFVLEERFVGFDPRAGGLVSQVLKVVVGFALIMGIRVGVKALFGDSNPVTFCRYVLIGLAATYLLPLIWSRLVTKDR